MNKLNNQLANFALLEKLGEGGMGQVFKGRDLTLDRLVAIKVMHPHLARQPDFKRRFLTEAMAASKLSHASIATVYEQKEAGGTLYLVMEFIQGHTLGRHIRQLARSGQTLPLGETLHLIGQIAATLGYAHRQGVIHRDIKPDNVMVKVLEEPERPGEPPLRAVVTDFGLAKLKSDSGMTATGTVMGTLHYMSPEQCRGRQVDHRTDLYALGIMLFELATGRLPFKIENSADAAEKHIRMPPPEPRTIQPNLPEPLQAIILKTLAKEPDDRYQSGEALAKALQSLSVSQDSTVVLNPKFERSFVDLHTHIASLAEHSAITDFGQGLSQAEQPQLVVAQKGTKPFTVPLAREQIYLGRSAKNEVVLPATAVSGRHALLERKIDGWYITDLGSTNGTKLAGQPLLPHIPDRWEPGQNVQIGPYFLRVPGGVAATRAAPVKSMMGRTLVTQNIPEAATVLPTAFGSLQLNPAHLELEPGTTGSARLLILNDQPTVNHLHVKVEGIPREWVAVSDPELHLMPGAEAAITLTLQPPRHVEAEARRHPFKVKLVEPDGRTQATINGVLRIKPFVALTSELRPAVVQDGAEAELAIRNDSNAEVRLNLALKDPADKVVAEQLPANLILSRGEAVTVPFVLQSRGRHLIGSQKSYSFELQMVPAEGPAVSQPGRLDVAPRLPIWLATLAGMMAALLCLGTILIGNAAFARSVEKDAAEEQAHIAAITLTVESEEAARQAQLQQAAANATATMAADVDGDGLSLAEEIALGTDPTLADSDGDGLNDGAEEPFGSNPLLADSDGDGLNDGKEKLFGSKPDVVDSDGDTLPDGAEVAAGTSPINIDTDGDGQNDNVDPAPGQMPTPLPLPTDIPLPTDTPPPTDMPTDVPTPTHTPTATPTPTATATATATATPSPTPTSTFVPIPASVVRSGPVTLLNNRTVYFIRLTQPGTIAVNATWSGAQDNLAIIINGPGQTGYYARKDGPSSLSVSYNVTAADYEHGSEWRVTIASFGEARADGTVTIAYPSGANARGFADEFAVLPTSGAVVKVLVLNGPGKIDAQATWPGGPSSLALIINGPGQVGYFAREDSGSPLAVAYNVSRGEFGAGNFWRVSLKTFSPTSPVNANVTLTHP